MNESQAQGKTESEAKAQAKAKAEPKAKAEAGAAAYSETGGQDSAHRDHRQGESHIRQLFRACPGTDGRRRGVPKCSGNPLRRTA